MSDALAGRVPQGRIGTVIKGKWQIDARIGSGGMATVYSATHRNGSRVAIKMLHPQLSRDPAVRSRFLREGNVANAVGHPGVVAVLDDGETEDGVAYLVLELLEGETIDARRLRQGGKLPLDEALDVADEALDALAAAHEKGIVHRDVKPENVFLTNDGRTKLLDFGLARMKDMQSEATQTGVTIGTPEFMPPEQAAGRRDAVDARSDVWGLGATIFTAITGRYVHDDAQSLHEQLIASATRRSKPIRQLEPQVPAAVAIVLDRALELEMSDRWQSAREMQAALREARTRPRDTSTHESVTLHIALPREDNPASQRSPRGVEPTAPANVLVPTAPVAWPPQAATVEQIQASFEDTQAVMLVQRPGMEIPMVVTSPNTARYRALAQPPTEPFPRPAVNYNDPSMHPEPARMPMNSFAGTGPFQAMPAPPPAPERRRGSVQAILVVALLLFAVCVAMAAYVLWRGPRLPY